MKLLLKKKIEIQIKIFRKITQQKHEIKKKWDEMINIKLFNLQIIFCCNNFLRQLGYASYDIHAK